MYKKVLVPLDGSQYSQCSLEHVRAIGLGCNVPEMILLRVIETDGMSQAGLKSQTDQSRKEAESEAQDYIASLTKRLKEEGLQVRGEVVSGKAADQITTYARTNRVDLIIMSTRGRSALAKWELGSVAKGVVDFSTVPVLLVMAAGCRVGQGC